LQEFHPHTFSFITSCPATEDAVAPRGAEPPPPAPTVLSTSPDQRFLDAHDAAEEILAFETSQMSADGDRVFVLGHSEGRPETPEERGQRSLSMS